MNKLRKVESEDKHKVQTDSVVHLKLESIR